MTNTELLKQKIKESGLKLGALVDALDTSYAWLKEKIEGNRDFKAYEIQILCKLLNIDLQEKELIFFCG